MTSIKNDNGCEFAEQILSDLISKGYKGEELLEKFKEQQHRVHPAIEKMLADAIDDNSIYKTYGDVFD